MKTCFLSILFGVLFASNIYAAMEEGVYIRGFGGLNYADIPSEMSEGVNGEYETKRGYVLGASIGYNFRSAVRIEGEFSYRENELEVLTLSEEGSASLSFPLKGHVDRYAVMGNAFMDLPIGIISPYVGGGLGYSFESGTCSLDDSRLNIDSQSEDTFKERRFAYQTIVGVSVQFLKKTDLRIDYRYLGTGADEISNDSLAFTLTQTF